LTLDFTLEKYEELLQALEEFSIFTVLSYFKKRPKSGFVILRHDVDRNPGNALRMAELETEVGIFSSYYFRYTNSSFKPELISKVSELGHEVGYHYETLGKTKGEVDSAINMFSEELKSFREFVSVSTVSMHGLPLSPIDNHDIWKFQSFESNNLEGDAVLSIYDDEVLYFTDTGRNWNNFNNIRDYTNLSYYNGYIDSTDDLVKLINDGLFDKLYINIHPERWADGYLEWVGRFLMDWSMNLAKNLTKYSIFKGILEWVGSLGL